LEHIRILKISQKHKKSGFWTPNSCARLCCHHTRSC